MTVAIIEALRKRLPPEEWAMFFEVSNRAGFGRTGSADVIAMNLWPSRGLVIHGFEIKVSRADWQRERKDPAKAETFVKKCDFWTLLAPEGVIPPTEVPATWGLWELTNGGGKFRYTKDATRNAEILPFTRDFMACLLKRDTQQHNAEVDAAVRKIRAAEEEAFDKRVQERVDYRTREHERLLKTVKDFEAASGLDISNKWMVGDIGKAVKTVMNRDAGHDCAVVERMRKALDEYLAAAKELA